MASNLLSELWTNGVTGAVAIERQLTWSVVGRRWFTISPSQLERALPAGSEGDEEAETAVKSLLLKTRRRHDLLRFFCYGLYGIADLICLPETSRIALSSRFLFCLYVLIFW